MSVKKSEASQRVLDALDKYIEGNFSEPMKWIVGLWRDQATVLTYGELMSIVTDEDLPKKIFDDWFGDYSRFVAQKMTPMWQEAMIAAVKDNPLFADVGEGFDIADYYVRDWMTTRSANLVTACLDEQRQAIRYIVSEGKANKWSTSETARYIRPTIGLTEQQAAANQKYYNTVKEQTRENHPRMTDEAVERKAREAAGRYAARQQRTRAETIARTEMATAYNEGNDQYVRQAMRRGQMPRMVKVWSTADDGHVCSACEDLEGVEVGIDDEFKVTVGKRIHREVATLLPPLHPRCKCAIMYEEAEEVLYENESEALESLSRIYVNSDDQLYDNLQFVDPIEGYEDYAAHSAEEGSKIHYTTTNGMETTYSGKEFAQMVKDDPSYSGGKVRLLVCGAGASDNRFAQEFANELGVDVLAPTETLWVGEKGELFVSNHRILAEMWYNEGNIDDSIKPTGEWKVFEPE